MSEPGEWKPVESFHIDNGELDPYNKQECFTLGVEWEMFRQKLASGEPFKTQIHTANRDRLKLMTESKGRKFSDYWLHEDYPEWRVVNVT